MAVENYVNTGSMDPYGSWRPEGALAGYMYDDKVNDYNKARDIQNQAGLLSNLQTQQSTDAFAQNQPVRDLQRQVTMGDLGNQQALQPGQRTLAMGSQQADITAAPFQDEAKIWQAASKLPVDKRAAQLKDITTAGSILKGMPPDSDSQDQLNMLHNSGVDISRWQGKSPEQVSKELGFIRNLDPDFFKQQRELELQSKKNEGTKAVAEITAKSRTDSATIRANILKSRGITNQAQLNAAWVHAMGKDPEERDADEESLVSNYGKLMSMLPNAQADAKSQVPAKEINEIQNSTTTRLRREKEFDAKGYSGQGNKKGENTPQGLEVLDKDGIVRGWIQ